MVTQWPFAKSYPVSSRGLVATKHPLAARVGVEVLRKGGNAVDAAVATSFTLNVVEPYMSGIGGGGLAVVRMGNAAAQALHFGMRAPASARPEMYEIIAGTQDSDHFGWPRTRDDANLLGPESVAVPGLAAGLYRMWARWGSMSWASLLEPAVALAAHGFAADWLLSLRILQGFELLSRFPLSAATFLPGGRPLKPDLALGPETLRQPALSETLQRLASDPGALAKRPAVQTVMDEVDGRLAPEDLDTYRALEDDALTLSFGDLDVCAVPWATGGATVLEWLGILRELDPPADESSLELWWAIIRAGDVAFADRLQRLADPDFAPFPQEILDPAYHRRMADCIRAGEVPELALPPAAGSTSHVSVVDEGQNTVSLTQTLLSLWGSGMFTAGGFCLNNGMMWFDPVPGRANSIAGGKRPLANMSPLLALREGEPCLSLGASGGRRIMPAEVQILVRVALLGASLDEAIAAPRLEISTSQIQADIRFDADFCRALSKRVNRPVLRREPVLGASPWASPVGLMRRPDGRWTGAADPYTLACVLEA